MNEKFKETEFPIAKKVLFRKEVIENKSHHFDDAVCINVPLQYQILVPVFLILIICIIIFLGFAQFTEKFIVSGYISSTKGVVRVYPSKNGVITQSQIIQGQHVRKGDKLFLIETADSLSKNNANSLLKQIKQRKAFVIKEINRKKKELNLLKGLLAKKYITQTVFNLKCEEIIKLKNDKIVLEIELIKHKQQKAYQIRAPIPGKITAVMYKQGQYIHTSKALVKILPEKDDLLAEIYIPVNSSGVISAGNKVLIRYDAYPYEHFGTYKAKIQDISQSILTDSEEEKPITIGAPYYKVTAVLDKQFVTIYGKNRKIQDGMTFTAVIKGRKRAIWQWILDPIYRYRGALFS